MFSATDVANFLACRHTVTLDHSASKNEIKRPFFNDPSIEVLQKLGFDHEKKYLTFLTEGKGRAVTQIDTEIPWEDARLKTNEALRRGDPAIYQATFLQGQWRGRADFLVRVETPSSLGPWSYEVVDTKLARSTKAGAVVQLCFYSDLLSRIQQLEPNNMHVVLGGDTRSESFPVHRYIAYYRRIRGEYEAAWKADLSTYPEPADHCKVCSWYTVCNKRRHDDDHLSLVAGISRNQRKALVERNVETVENLADLALPVTSKIERIGKAALERIQKQARIQIKGREQAHAIYELVEPVEAGAGFAVLPAPSPRDVFLDLEANPYVLDQGLEYLFGFVTLPSAPHTEPQYEAFWSSTRAEEKEAFEEFVARMMDRFQRDPAMHIYHYAPYEPAALKRLSGRHGTCAEDLDKLLRAEVFVDLYRVVRQGIRVSVESYSIKKLEPLYNFVREVPLPEANFALNSYEALLALGENRQDSAALLKTIEGYNRDDCFSALRLRDWLEERRIELQKKTQQILPRPELKSGEASTSLAAGIDEVNEIKHRLIDNLPADELEWTEERRARWLLAQMLEWHRREDKSSWWEYFRRCELSDDELQEDRSALGGLIYQGEVDRVKKSIIHRYKFPPQEHTIDRALEAHDPRTRKGAGDVWAIDEHNRTIDLKRGVSSETPPPSSLIPYDIMKANAQAKSLQRLASWFADNGIDHPGQFRAARDLLLHRLPLALKQPIETPLDDNAHLTRDAKVLVHSLATEPSVLPIQGPPGSGKTFTGARMIVELVKQGRRVGISAVSHKVISYLLREACETAGANGVSLKAIQKVNNREDGCEHDFVTVTCDNQAVVDAFLDGTAQIGAGTAWLWARPEMANAVDVLFIDEAGQMSLASTLGIAQAATSIVLLGDPQQLDQPQRGVHPLGAEVSALGHLLNGEKTINNSQGLFLAETRRLHPDVCSFTSEIFYDGRLVSRPENATQRLNAPGPLDGTGLRYAPVEHSGNQNESREEVARIVALVNDLLTNKSTWTDKEGTISPLTINDILIVAPYNAQVAALLEALPDNARVGTVDKFQGQEAPVVIYSMATSTPEDAPRGMEFLYSLNRLNVAISRARCVAVLVASPTLFHLQCKTPRQIELANAFYRYLEMAQEM